MGCCFGKLLQDADDKRSHSGVPPPDDQPPSYSAKHTESCLILTDWEKGGEKSRNYEYVIYYIHNPLLPDNVKRWQDHILGYINILAKIQELRVLVKCLDVIPKSFANETKNKERHLYMSMLAADEISNVFDLWTTYKKENPYFTKTLSVSSCGTSGSLLESRSNKIRSDGIKSAKEQIEQTIQMLQEKSDMDDSDAKNFIEPSIVAALSGLNKGWDLEEFLKNKQNIFDTQYEKVEATGTSKLSAQFFLQLQAAYTSFSSESGKTTVTINIVPETITNALFGDIVKSYGVIEQVLNVLAKGPNRPSRQDRAGIQLVSFGERKNGGDQWSALDDRKKGATDITNHLYLNIGKLDQYGVGPSLAAKLMLGSVDASHDLDSKEKTQKLYGNARCRLTVEELRSCYCRGEKDNANTQSLY